ncbi:putative c6 zinc finger domain-containing protein [Phaeoacremonium minimum UCRPA7]|uniref:Putative c6 zinc finger domain-containing protein n=1 Tax=Phaeoacremonium minimum (strain UCR-PA7) TaxID=1286976 RepID=R8BYJ2_PHAM7|nr:putative c6 zinc finger domain-containing protein [Phaeoacremonium minimum UCRPA7]EOO04412.1 putative c6 zinc finger domain-containing protein [Phaeoacremonium minimum UCRPA7]
MEIDRDMEMWESERTGTWQVTVESVEGFPPEAIFRGKYHVYEDMWTARTWSHYRWARILIEQMILEFVERYPMSSLGYVSVTQQEKFISNIGRLAVEILQSSPCHYKDPRLSEEQQIKVQIQGGPSAGAVGVPAIVFHLKTAACAPGVSKEIWQWALDLMDTIWGDLGMLHARSLAEVLRAHQDKLEREVAEGLLTHSII